MNTSANRLQSAPKRGRRHRCTALFRCVHLAGVLLALFIPMWGCSESPSNGPPSMDVSDAGGLDSQVSPDVTPTSPMDAAPVADGMMGFDAVLVVDGMVGRDAVPTPDVSEQDVRAVDAHLADTLIADAEGDQMVVPDAGCIAQMETCNGRDDDCNGMIDDVDGVGDACFAGLGTCRGEGTQICDDDTGELVCTAVQGQPGPEVCNLIDDDCDGAIDEEDPGGGVACETERLGLCRAGRTRCADGEIRCVSVGVAGVEVCNGQDDDCDGVIDNMPPAGGCETDGLGVCAPGLLQCAAGVMECIQTNQPSPELCDGLDNDCNGQVDEDPTDTGGDCRTNRPGACRAGRVTCDAGRTRCISLQAGEPERCDGDDQDCDGRVDENVPGVGDECDPGWATPDCARRARLTCENGWQSCQPDAAPADPCNGIDDDCDGRVGEDLLGRVCEVGALGQCNIGGSLCEGDVAVCVPGFEPDCEIENGLDDDCDGETDEAPQRFCAPRETQLSRFCLEDNNRIAGFDMVVDPYGEIWAVRATINNGTIFLSRVRHDGTEVREQIYGRTAVSGISPMVDAGITLHEERPAVCFWKATTRTLFAAIRGPDGAWTAEEIIDRNVSGEDCEIASINGQLLVAYRDQGALWLARRVGVGQWQRDAIDAPDGRSVGHDLQVALYQGAMYIAHQDTDRQQLRVTAQVNGVWRTLAVDADGPQGYRPAIRVTEEWIYVLHGEAPQVPDIGGDSAIYFTEIRRADSDQQRTSLLIGASAGGGQALMVYGDGLLGFLRGRLRDAVFGDQDKLTIIRLIQGQLMSDLEVHGLADRRRTFTRLTLETDPFGLPITGFVDEGGPANNDRGFGRICFYRPNDLDGDHIPDAIELDLGTDPDRADTDNDGRSDGQEVLRDGTDPLRR